MKYRINVMTEKRQDILDAIRQYVAQYGIAPSFAEIGAMTGCAPSQVRHHLRVLRENGVVAYDDWKARSIRIIGQAPAPDAHLESAYDDRFGGGE